MNTRAKIVLASVICLSLYLTNIVFGAETIAKITIKSEKDISENVAVSVELKKIPNEIKYGYCQLIRENDGESQIIPFQIENSQPARLWFLLPEKLPANQEQVYKIISGQPTQSPLVQIKMDCKTLTLSQGCRKALQYYYGEMEPPEGDTELYTRSGFFHPIWTPGGKVLTRIHPFDHVHHMGFWLPWTNTEFEGRHVDFWNVDDSLGTVRFVKFNDVTTGPVFGGFEALQHHLDVKAPEGEKVVLNELRDVRVWNTNDPDDRFSVWDVTSTQTCASSSPLLLHQYRYGGMGFRGPASWTPRNSNYLTSEGKTRKDGNGTRARWFIIYGKTDEGHAGILLMSHPDNHEHPEPLRIWPDGDIFCGFCPVVVNEWLLEPGKDYVRKYRAVAYDGKMTAEEAEQFWQDWVNAPRVETKLKNK